MIIFWIQNIRDRCFAFFNHSSTGKFKTRTRLAVERLEDRLVPATFAVDTLSDESDGDYSEGDLSLREAIELANANPGADTITFDTGLNEQVISLTEGELKISDSVTVDGDLDKDGTPDVTVQREPTADDFRIFHVNDDDASIDQDVVLQGLIIQGGRAIGTGTANHGGGIRNRENLSIHHSTLRDNIADTHGGGINSEQGRLTVLRTTVTNNSARFGGGIRSSNSGVTTIQNSAIHENTASFGGGLYNGGSSTMDVQQSTISKNSARFGGGIYTSGQLTALNNTLSENAVEMDGGAIYVNVGTITMQNTTVSGNMAGRNGGAILNNSGRLTFSNSTIVLNQSDSDNDNNGTGGIHTLRDRTNTTILHSSIVAGNTRGPSGSSDDLNGLPVDAASSHNLIGDINTAGGLTHGVNDNIVGDGNDHALDINTILDTTLADNGGPTNTHAVKFDSPALDAGKAFDASTDQRGYDRAVDLLFADNAFDGTDMGAFEYGVPELQTTYAFESTGNLWLNWGGLQEKWFVDQNKEWYFITPEGLLYRWGGNEDLSTSTFVAQVDSSIHHDLSLLFDPGATTPSYAAAELQTSNGFVAGDDLWENWGGWEEKWFVDQSGVSHFITPSGRIYQWDGGSDLASRTMIAQVDASVYEDLTLLLDADASVVQQTVSEVQATFGFYSTGDIHENWAGWGEKWFLDATDTWHFMTASGRIYQWTGGTNLTDSILVAQVEAGIHADLTQLFNA